MKLPYTSILFFPKQCLHRLARSLYCHQFILRGVGCIHVLWIRHGVVRSYFFLLGIHVRFCLVMQLYFPQQEFMGSGLLYLLFTSGGIVCLLLYSQL